LRPRSGRLVRPSASGADRRLKKAARGALPILRSLDD
jgi:hypothetical protein